MICSRLGAMPLVAVAQRAATQPARSIYTLSAVASFCAKGTLRNLNKTSGEDAVVNSTWIIPGPRQGTVLVGVADGVGGWRRHGVDPAVLSAGVVREIAGQFRAREKERHAKLPDGRHLLRESFRKLCRLGEKYAGGTTVCFGIFDPRTGKLRVVNLGDSGAMLVRKGRVVHHTEPESEGLVPRQLTILPRRMVGTNPELESRLDPVEQTRCGQAEWQLEVGDVVLFASDGFFDNVHTQQACHIIDHTIERSDPGMGMGMLPKQIGENLLMRAYYNSLNPYFPSPFAVRCMHEGLLPDFRGGGKPDDISIVACVVGETLLTNTARPASRDASPDASHDATHDASRDD